MRQPEVIRVRGFGLEAPLAGLVLALVLVLPLVFAGRSMLVAGAFLAEFLSSRAVRPLTRLTPPPTRRAMTVPGVAVDLYALPHARPGTAMVLVHGLSPEGKDDPRLRDAAELLARAGFDVAVPTIPGLTRLRLRPEDRNPVVATLAARDEPTVLLGISVGAGPALLAAADPSVRDRVRVVVSLGGYASAFELARFFLTGDFAYGGERGHIEHDPALIREFIAANSDILDASARRVLSARDSASVSASLAALSPELRALLAALSPEGVAREIRAPLILVHGRGDVLVPYTETLRLRAARPERTKVVLVGVVGHVEGVRPKAIVSELRDLILLWSVMYRLLAVV